MVTTALIADDERHLAEYLRTRLGVLWPDLSVLALARNGQEAVELIRDEQPDIVFLDIKMPGLTGLQVAGQLGDRPPHVVFVTAFDQYAIDAFEHQAADYLLKPVTDERLTRTVARLKAALAKTESPANLQSLLAQLGSALQGGAIVAESPRLRWLRVSVGEEVRQIAVEDVLYFRAADKYTIVQVRGERAAGDMLIRLSLSELNSQLDPNAFWQIHRGTIVNLAHVAATRRDVLGKLYVALKNHPTELAVSRHYAHLFKQM